MKRAVVVLLLLIANTIVGESTQPTSETAPSRLLREWQATSDAGALREIAEMSSTAGARNERSPSDMAQGAAPGMSAAPSILWNEGSTVVALSNVDPTVAQNAAAHIADRTAL